MAREDYAMADVRGQAQDGLNAGVDKASEAAEVVAEKSGELMCGVRGNAKQMAGHTREGCREVEERVQGGLRLVGAAVRENPGPSVAMVFGFGIVIGAVIGLGLRSRRG
jgi:ElaB/YqjD/DUF883 family membrane-anchored ribosome-binding protein